MASSDDTSARNSVGWLALPCVFVLLLLSTSASAQVGHHSLGMDAWVAGSGGSGGSRTSAGFSAGGQPLGNGWSTAEVRDYTQRREQGSSLRVEVQVRNIGQLNDVARLDWYFFSRPNGGRSQTIFDQGAQDLAIPHNGTLAFSIRSPMLHSATVRKLVINTGVGDGGAPIPPSATVQKSGARVSGWIVRLLVEGQPVVVRASSPSLLSIAPGLEAPSPGKK